MSKRADGRYEIKRTIAARYSADGKSYRKSFYSDVSLQDCQDQYKAFLIGLGAGYVRRLPTERRDFASWARLWLDTYKRGKVKESTYIETYERTVNNYLIPYFGDSDITKIQPLDVQVFLNDMQQRYSDSTLSKIRICLNGIFDAAVDNGCIAKNVAYKTSAKSMVPREEKRTYTQEQRDNIIKFARTHPDGVQVCLLIEVGLRISEMAGAQYGDIDYESHTIHVQRTCTAVNYRAFISEKMKNKNSKRILPISTALCEQIREASRGHSPGDFIMTGTTVPKPPDYFTKHGYRMFFKAFFASSPEYAGYPALAPHELRHTCGTLFYANTKDIYAVSKYLGHANIDITVRTYVHDSEDILRAHLRIE